jgi:hypothetical protein
MKNFNLKINKKKSQDAFHACDFLIRGAQYALLNTQNYILVHSAIDFSFMRT